MASSSPGGWSDLDSADGAGSAEWEALHDSDGSPADAAGQNARAERDAWDVLEGTQDLTWDPLRPDIFGNAEDSLPSPMDADEGHFVGALTPLVPEEPEKALDMRELALQFRGDLFALTGGDGAISAGGQRREGR